MKTIEIANFPELLDTLQGLMTGPRARDLVYRGHGDASWKIASTFSRFSTTRIRMFDERAIKLLVREFVDGLASLGQTDLLEADYRTKLEMARHYDVPSPLIDFSRSPFIALWFAFNGIGEAMRQHHRDPESAEPRLALYAFDTNLAGVHFQRRTDPKKNERVFGLPLADFFRWEVPDLFSKGYPQGIMKFIRLTSPLNTRMQRQAGVFVYDTMDYSEFKAEGFEDFFGDDAVFREDGIDIPVLIKIVMPAGIRREVFEYLEILGIDGARLYDDHTGVAADVKNVFNYDRARRYWEASKLEG